MQRFHSGPNRSYKQAPRKFDFEWSPGEIKWKGDRGEGHSYSVHDALTSGAPDFTQCLPADVEIRMNLWNLLGTSKPSGLEDHHIVEVVIDDFKFNPSKVKGLNNGDVCTKGCQCKSQNCVGNRCRRTRSLQQASTAAHVSNSTNTVPSQFSSLQRTSVVRVISVCSWLLGLFTILLLLDKPKIKRLS